MPTLIFDCDGVLADTEQDGHLRAFNATFTEFGLPVRWSVADYAEKVKIGGGKERLRSLLTPQFINEANISADPAEQLAAVAKWHGKKTEIYTKLVDEGVLPARPGIKRIVSEAIDAGWTLAVASTSARPSVEAVLAHAVGPDLAAHFTVFAGDDVACKKPAPDIYLLALNHLGVDPAQAIVIEDSENGLRAALGADLRTVVTVSTFTTMENFSGASLVVSSLGDHSIDGVGEPSTTLQDPLGFAPGDVVVLDVLERILALPRPARDALLATK